MDFTGIIAEYDPFHNGHAAQLAAVRAAGAQCIAVCMSSGAVQRGGVPILPESVRVRAALDAGADLVVALPAPYACATAEQFAAAGVHLLAALGCDTLALRMEKHCSNAKAVAAFLDKHPKIEWVKHPSLPSDKYHSLAEKYLPNGTGGMMSFGIKGDVKRCARFMEALKLVTQETHVADVRSCVLHPASTTHRQLSKTDLAKAGVPENLIRLSVGIENPQDIIQDLSDALDQI